MGGKKTNQERKAKKKGGGYDASADPAVAMPVAAPAAKSEPKLGTASTPDEHWTPAMAAEAAAALLDPSTRDGEPTGLFRHKPIQAETKKISAGTAFLETADELKKEGNELYLKEDNIGAMTKYGLAIDAFEDAAGEVPEALEHRKALAVLYSNRAMAALAIVRKEKKPGSAGWLPKELRKHALCANADASQAIELDDGNGKAWLRRGQASMCMTPTQQRAKQAVEYLKKAKDAGLPASLQAEQEQWYKYAKGVFDSGTNMPEQCPQM